MLRNGLHRLFCSSMSQLTQANAAAEGIASLKASTDAFHHLLKTSVPVHWRLYSTLDGSDNTPIDSDKSSEPASNALAEDSAAVTGSSSVTSTALPSEAEIEGALAEWGSAMDDGDWDVAWRIFESSFPVESEVFPTLEELLKWDPDDETKAVRRKREFSLQEDAARGRVRRVDAAGMAHGVGKRKTSVARVWIREGAGHMMVNRRPYDAYFPALPRRNDLITPFLVTNTLGRFDVMVAVEGGGQTGQAQAMRHGIARALQNWDPKMRSELKTAGLLTRDSRIVERKKPGLKKARKAFQWVKR